MMFEFISILFFVIQGSAAGQVKLAECLRVYDKYDHQTAASRNFKYGAVWPQNKIPYVIESGFTKEEIEIIRSAMKHISDRVCVKWVPRNGESNYVRINHDKPGCFATLGYNSRRGMHNLNLQRDDGQSTCIALGLAAHEMLHIMGFDHEHCRPDRNKYVKVNWKEMAPQCYDSYFRDLLAGSKERLPTCKYSPLKKSYDDCYSGYRTETFGMNYDYGSIMHYSLKKCSVSGGDTMSVLGLVPIGIKIGALEAMSQLDVQKARAKYGCDGRTTTTPKPGIECKDESEQCPELKSQCKKDKKVYDGCPVTCNKCKECYDRLPECKFYADQCGGNDLVDDGCHLTCGTC